MTAIYGFLSRWAALLFLLTICPFGYSQVDEDDELPEFLPGLLAEFELSQGSADAPGQPHQFVKRFDHDVLFDWNAGGAGLAADPRADTDSPIQAKWTGFLETKESGQFKIHAYAAGRLSVRLNDKPILSSHSETPQWVDSPSIELPFGRHPIEIQYEVNGKQRQVGLYWSGPQFELEPISHRFFSHRSEISLDNSFERGLQLSRALRCTACHDGQDTRPPLAAPALTHLDGNLHREWLIERLTARDSAPGQRMPHFGLSTEDAEALADTLWAASQPSAAPKIYKKPKETAREKEEPAPRTTPTAEEGRIALLTLGCLACHQLGELGEKHLFDGGELSSSAVGSMTRPVSMPIIACRSSNSASCNAQICYCTYNRWGMLL
jgi:cytochrome c553